MLWRKNISVGNNLAITKHIPVTQKSGKAFEKEKEFSHSMGFVMEKLTLSKLNTECVYVSTNKGHFCILSDIIHGFKINIFCFFLYQRK